MLSEIPESTAAATSMLAVSVSAERVAATGSESGPLSSGSSTLACSGATSPEAIAASIAAAGSICAETSGSSGSASMRSVYSSLSASDSPFEASVASLIPVSVPKARALSSTIPTPIPGNSRV